MKESIPTGTRSLGRRMGDSLFRHPFVALVLVLGFSALCARLGWGWHLSRHLEAKLDELRKAGHPTKLAEVVLDPVPDSENAWLVYLQAAGALQRSAESPRNSNLDYPHYPPYGAAWEKLAAASELTHGRAFQLARSARLLDRAQLHAAFLSTSGISTWQLNQGRFLANTLADAAVYAHLKADDAEAVERLLDLLHLGRSTRQDRMLISHLVAIGYDALALVAAQSIAPTLAVGPAGARGGTAASPEQVRSIIATMLDERDAHAWFARSISFERAFVLDGLTEKAEGTWAIRPLADRTKLRWLADLELLVEAAGAPDLATARPVLARIDKNWEPAQLFMFGRFPSREIPRYSRWFEKGGPGSAVHAFEQDYRLSAERRVTAVSFATRLYRLEHGRWPERLADLVPAYLPAVPIDPFLAGNQPLGYVIQRGALPDGGDRPLVYFDAGGATDAVIDSEPMYGWRNDQRPGRREPNRQYRDLALWLPTARRFDEQQKRLTAEAVEDDPEEADAPGDDAEQDDDAGRPAEK